MVDFDRGRVLKLWQLPSFKNWYVHSQDWKYHGNPEKDHCCMLGQIDPTIYFLKNFLSFENLELWKSWKSLIKKYSRGIQGSIYTLPRKNMNLPCSICMYWTNFWQPTIPAQQNIFEKTLIEVGCPHLYASFGTFCAQIGQLFKAQWVFEICLKINKSLSSKENVIDFVILSID